MAGISDALLRLRQLRQLFEKRLQTEAATSAPKPDAEPSRLREVTNFGSNPGNLRLFSYVPEMLAPSPALVVALHGCTQSAASYDRGTGWSDLADRYGFAVIFPEQQAANNPKSCFSWFLPGDTASDAGEALSIRQMIETATTEFGVDRNRIFVTGLSAGGAMASVMLATYPETFAGGAIIAGLPYGAASSVQEAFDAMFNDRAPSSRALGDRVRAASKHRGPWPKVSVWHGTADSVVRPSNADHIIRQWLEMHSFADCSPDEEQVGPHTRRIWRDVTGETRVESYSLLGMGHGVPLAVTGTEGCGSVGPYFLETGVSSSYLIARSWGLETAVTSQPNTRAADGRTLIQAHPPARVSDFTAPAPELRSHNPRPKDALTSDATSVIEVAFKAAGLPAPERNSAHKIDAAAIIAAALKAAGLKRT